MLRTTNNKKMQIDCHATASQCLTMTRKKSVSRNDKFVFLVVLPYRHCEAKPKQSTSGDTNFSSLLRINTPPLLRFICVAFFLLVFGGVLLASEVQKPHESAQPNALQQAQMPQGLLGLPNDVRKVGWHGYELYSIPYFTIQVGMGGAHTKHIAAQNSEISSSGIPTFSLGVGFMQQYYIVGVNFGYSLKLAYEIGVKSLGENTMSFRNSSAFAQFHIGYKWILPYGSVGYELLSVGQAFIASSGESILHANRGIAYSGGVMVLLNRYHALNLEIRKSTIYGPTPRIIVGYEFRF